MKRLNHIIYTLRHKYYFLVVEKKLTGKISWLGLTHDLDKSDEDNYCSFLIGKGWFEMSLTLQISMLDKAEHEKFNKWFNLAKKQYPEAFKPEE